MLRDSHLDSASRNTFFPILHSIVLWRLGVEKTNLEIPIKDGENPPSARHWCGDALCDPKRRLKGLPSAPRMQILRYIYPAENSQDKWNETIDSANSKG
jgi:hypothetical protein